MKILDKLERIVDLTNEQVEDYPFRSMVVTVVVGLTIAAIILAVF